ncbi:uncharacterized protein [Littorina saxatilis]|uniref:uncharacterized protein isoform X1 n=1 Tax=Littorina saxatilis TaxID=31220 RepID=UPI0038B6063D
MMSLRVADFMYQLSRELPEPETATKLFPTNFQVERYNRQKLLGMPGQLQEFHATDEGDVRSLKNTRAPKILWLKKDCPVMLIRNISDQLVNGSLGHVVDLHHDKVVVHFEKTNMTVELSRIAFSVHDPRQKKDIAVRHQFPLVPSFALTIHKAQGLTLERVEIDCEEVFQPGQIGVALGRARSIEGLRVVNFDTRKVLPQPSTVHDYYKVGSAEVNENLTCCRHKRFQTTYAEDTANEPREEDVPLEGMDQEPLDDDPDVDLDCTPLEFKAVLVDLTNKQVTPQQKSVSQAAKQLLMTPVLVDEFLRKVYGFMLRKILALSSAEKVDSRLITIFYSECHAFLSSRQYVVLCRSLFGCEAAVTDANFLVAHALVLKVRQLVVHQEARRRQPNVPGTAEKSNIRLQPDLSDAPDCRAKVRHVAGYCIAKLRERKRKALMNNIFKKGEAAEQALCDADLLGQASLTESEASALTSDLDSLSETARKQNQNVRQSLTHVTDTVYVFFECLVLTILSLQTEDNLHDHGKLLYHFVVDKVIDDVHLFSLWTHIFSAPPSSRLGDNENSIEGVLKRVVDRVECLTGLFRDIVHISLNILNNQFRKDFLHQLQVQKEAAHRIQIKIKKMKTKQEAQLSYYYFDEDASHGKIVFLHRLQAVLQSDGSCDHFTKNQLVTICDFYKVRSSMRMKKDDLMQQLKDFCTQPVAEGMACAGPSMPSTSGTESESAIDIGSGIQTVMPSSSPSKCHLCKGQYKKRQHWITCDSCRAWFHRKCAGMGKSTDWSHYCEQGAKWYCKNCDTAGIL